ncbi:MAG: hypothetical protein HN475_02165 [Piscirickettsiaceae bacterium]|jgi:hypothetical protein|nr:hypothetical protein [Piscirickettsiaceae bacterium]
MMQTKPVVALLIFSFLMMPFGLVVAKHDKEITRNKQIVAGWLENVVLEPWQIKLRAKLDTGAKTSSLHAIDIQRFTQNGEPWVRFLTEDKKNEVSLKPVELPVKREVKIKSHHKDAVSRPVVELQLCLNGHLYKGEFSLVDRSRFNYPILLGRRVLKQRILVDASMTFTLPINSRKCERLLEDIL